MSKHSNRRQTRSRGETAGHFLSGNKSIEEVGFGCFGDKTYAVYQVVPIEYVLGLEKR
ncbi:MAG TPA: hypothetical protein GXX40_02405 [Firmicutes bacterium]|nr:hypothetical protein [Bacillota bacterium]